MRIFGSTLRSSLAGCALIAIAGCQGATQTGVVPASTSSLTLSPAAKAGNAGELLYSSTLDWNTGNGQVYVYHAYGKNTSQIGELDINPGFPEGLWSDAKGDVYIAVVNAGPKGAGYVAEYSPGLKTLKRTITAGLSGPSSGAFDSAGNLYITNLCQRGAYSCSVFARTNGLRHPGLVRAHKSQLSVYGYVSVYSPGKSQPSNYLSPPITNPIGVTVDPAGNVFVINLMGDPVASEFPAGSNNPETVPFKGLPSQPTPLGVTMSPSGALVIAINTNIDFFPAEKGKPARMRHGMIAPFGLAYGRDGTLFGGNYEFEENEGNVVAYPPGSKTSTRTYAVPYNNGVTGVAVGPSGDN
jgi:hypothetical protein